MLLQRNWPVFFKIFCFMFYAFSCCYFRLIMSSKYFSSFSFLRVSVWPCNSPPNYARMS